MWKIELLSYRYRDAIDYAIGMKIQNGCKTDRQRTSEPFPLKYVELGNEQWGPFYPPIHDIFYGVLKQEYPQITFISTLQVDLDAYSMNEADMIDPHYYQTAEWFYDNTHYWDMVKRKDYKVYVGEYACNQNVGAGHMGAALSEAAYMIGMERNSDMVTMSSYAPLIENNLQAGHQYDLGKNEGSSSIMYNNCLPISLITICNLHWS